MWRRAFSRRAACLWLLLRPNRKDVLETFAEPFRRYMKAIGWEEGRSVSSKPQVKKRHRLD
jgi:hypothetical protein